jgi:hypothetical protein
MIGLTSLWCDSWHWELLLRIPAGLGFRHDLFPTECILLAPNSYRRVGGSFILCLHNDDYIAPRIPPTRRWDCSYSAYTTMTTIAPRIPPTESVGALRTPSVWIQVGVPSLSSSCV